MNQTMSPNPQARLFGRPATAVILPALAGLSVMLCLPALMMHIKSKNVAAAILVTWVTLSNFFNFINPLIWPTDDLDSYWSGVGLCDIEVKVSLASSAAIPGALICIFRQLSIILNTEKASGARSRGQRRRQLAFEIFFCGVVPVYMMVIHVVVQPYRYYIFAIAGCTPALDNSWPGIVLIFIPPLVLCVVAAGYCILNVVRLIRYWNEFSSILASSISKLNKSRFLRLFILSTTLIMTLLPVSIYVFIKNLEYPRHQYSWSSVHQPGWSTVIACIPTQGVVLFDRWISVALGYAVFAFFGFGSDAVRMYRGWVIKLRGGTRRLSRKNQSAGSHESARRLTDGSEVTKVGSISSHVKAIFHHKESDRSMSTVSSSSKREFI